jgi:hypothetical protein
MKTFESVPAESQGLRVFRTIGRLGLAASVTSLLALGFLGFSSLAREQLSSAFFGNWDATDVAAAQLAVGFAIAVFGMFGLLVWLCRRLAWRALILGYIVAASVMIYLVADEATLRHPQTMEELSPKFPGAAESFNLLMRYGKDHPLAKNFKVSPFKGVFPHMTPELSSDWRETITQHRADFEAHWVELDPVRSWWAELNAFDRIGDLTPPREDAEMLSFTVFRTMSQHGLAIASLQALDGRGDDAIDTLIPILEVGRKLQPYSRTFSRGTLGVVIERISLETANFVLENSSVSPAARSRLATALQGADPEAGARHLVATEYVFQLNAFEGKPLGSIYTQVNTGESKAWLRRTLNAVGPFVYNPRITFNDTGDLSFDLQDLAAHRQVEQIDSRTKGFVEENTHRCFKNLFGRLLMQATTQTYSRAAEFYWKNYDLRTALLVRASKP